jgi:hypothetical protein
MAKAGKRYPLLIYDYTLGRWYPATFTLSLFLFLIWWFLPEIQNKSQRDWQDLALLSVSGITLLATVFLFLMRKMAYVRPYRKYLLLATPLFRLKISYKRIIQTRATEMRTLFPPSLLTRWQRDSMAHLLKKTAVVTELNAFPLSPLLLRLFLSPFFFKDKTPHFVFLVEDWMRFSSELDSFRSGGDLATGRKKKGVSSILSAISKDQ